MPWVNRNGHLLLGGDVGGTAHAWMPPGQQPAELEERIRWAGFEFVEAITGPGAGEAYAAAEYARRWAAARADEEIRTTAARALQPSGTLAADRMANRSSGVWANAQGQLWRSNNANSSPEVLAAEEVDRRVAAGFRFIGYETWNHPTLRRLALDTLNQDGEVEAARQRLAERLAPRVPLVRTWVNVYGVVHPLSVPNPPRETELAWYREGWLPVDARATDDADRLHALWSLARDEGHGAGAWLMPNGTITGYPPFHLLTEGERQALEDDPARLRWVAAPGLAEMSLGMRAGLWAESDRVQRQVNQQRDAAAERTRQRVSRGVDPPARTAAEALSALDAEAEAEAVDPVIPRPSRRPPPPAYVEVRAPDPRAGAWSAVLDALLDALQALPVGDPQRYEVAADLGGLLNRGVRR